MRIVRNGTLATRTAIWAAVITALCLSFSSRASAQEITRYDVFGGYSYLRFDSPTIGFANQSNTNGWNIDGAINIGDSFSGVANVSGNYGSKLTLYNFMIGPRYSLRFEKSRIFVQGLFGKAQNSVHIPQPTRNNFESVGRAFSFGAGYEWDVNHRFSFRVIQAEYLNTNTFGVSQNDLRVSTGLVVHLGHTGRRPRL